MDHTTYRSLVEHTKVAMLEKTAFNAAQFGEGVGNFAGRVAGKIGGFFSAADKARGWGTSMSILREKGLRGTAMQNFRDLARDDIQRTATARKIGAGVVGGGLAVGGGAMLLGGGRRD